MTAFVKGVNLLSRPKSRFALLNSHELFTRFYSDQKGLKICLGCGSPLSIDPKRPGFFPETAPRSPEEELRERKEAQRSEIFLRAIAELDENTRKEVLPDSDGEWQGDIVEKKESAALCTRCHSLKHHSTVPPDIQEEKASPFDIFSEIRADKNALVVNVVDIMDFPLSLLDIRKHIGPMYRVIHVLNRADILYKKPIHAREVREKLTSILGGMLKEDSRIDVRVVSALKGWEIDTLAKSLMKRKGGVNIYFVGSANAGKSSLMSALGRRADTDAIQTPTTSHIPGTTLASIPVKVEMFGGLLGGGGGSVIDLPGVLQPGLADMIYPTSLRFSLPHKYIKGRPVSLGQGESLILGDLIRIDHVSGDETHILVTPYTHLTPHCTSRPEHILDKPSEVRSETAPAFSTALEHEFVTTKGGRNVVDIVLKDIGFVSVALWKGKSKVRVWSPGGLHVGLRNEPLFENSYEAV